MRVHWTNTAVEHLLAIYEYIAQDSPVYAQRMIDRLTRRSEQIATFPLSGCMVPEYEAQDIRGIGPKKLENIRPYLLVGKK
ncbi:MAG: type II toxin-antitoxin system RelE/ParE family toxin [Thermodesulfobacteriota bacterium]